MSDTDLAHYGTPRHSGRYPWGSGQDPEQHSRSLLGHVKELEKNGVSEAKIAEGFGLTTTQLRAERSIASNVARKADIAQALRLQDKGMSNVAIGKQMGKNESAVRGLLNPANKDKQDVLQTQANLLRSKVGEDRYLDIGAGTENHMGISATRLKTAVAILQAEGYEVRNIQVPNLGSHGNKTTVKTLVPPGAPRFIDPTKINAIAAYTEDGGHTFEQIKPPINIDSKRIGIRYAEQGGANADGVVYLRPGVPDISLGKARYAQVRIAVDGTHYLKGMAMYKDDLPEGVDLQFNTNKSDTGNKLDALKSQKDDETNPFGAVIRQKTYVGEDGKDHQSPINIVNEEGDWKDWSRSLSSQFLSKQSTGLANKQLSDALATRKEELDEITKLTNPIVKKKLLETFADGADSAAIHLKASALPGQGTHVILPVETLKENEIYAPNYRNGTKVALVRFPHGGTFEIPEVTVNNKHADASALLGGSGLDKEGRVVSGAIDAIGIHPTVAARLSGADFDGDTVLVIPNNNRAVKTSPPLKNLENFNPSESYAPFDGMHTIDGGIYHAADKSVDYGTRKDGTPAKPSGKRKQQQMGDVSNLITDMTIKGAKPDELAAAVRHSMVVIDAEKHRLNYKQSYIDNGIPKLKETYQGRGSTGRLSGASTLISRSGTNSKIRVLERKERGIDPDTGKKIYENTNASYVDKTGKIVVKTTEVPRLGAVDDAHTLSSGIPIENIYADYSNAVKVLANTARKEEISTGNMRYSPSAAKTYATEVSKLNADLNTAIKNKPFERQAQLVANAIVSATTADNPGMENADLKKIKGRALQTARDRVGAKKIQVEISPQQWEAIQAGAISSSKLASILDNSDIDRVRELATPRAVLEMTPSKLSLAKARLASGYTQAEVADSLGVPVSTLNSALKREGG